MASLSASPASAEADDHDADESDDRRSALQARRRTRKSKRTTLSSDMAHRMELIYDAGLYRPDDEEADAIVATLAAEELGSIKRDQVQQWFRRRYTRMGKEARSGPPSARVHGPADVQEARHWFERRGQCTSAVHQAALAAFAARAAALREQHVRALRDTVQRAASLAQGRE